MDDDKESLNLLCFNKLLMAHSNEQLIRKFYEAFSIGDAATMVSCYHDDIVFEDPAFGQLKGEHAKNMWRMLIERSKGGLKLKFSDIEANEHAGKAYWEADYIFSKTGRKVNNKINAFFRFKDGKIIEHTDKFSFWRWSSQALGAVGLLLGFTPIVKNKVRKNCLVLLETYEIAMIRDQLPKRNK